MDRRKVLGFALGPVGAAALSMISLPIMTWIFPPDDIGKLSMLQVAINFSTLLCCLGLDQAYVREYHESRNKPKLFLNATLPGLVILALLLVALMLIAPRAAARLLYGDSSAVLAAVTGVALLIAFVSRFLSLILRMEDRGFAFSMSQILAKALLLTIVVVYALTFKRRDFLMLLLAQIAALGIAMLVFGWNTRHEWVVSLRSRFDGPEFRRLLQFGWPLVLGGVASWALAAMDRIFLRSMSTYEELAVYSVAASIASGATIVAGIFNIIWAPTVYKWVADKVDMARLDSIAYQLAVILFLLVCGAGCFAWILDFILPSDYSRVSLIVVGCTVAPLFYTLSEVTGIGIAIARRTKLSMVASLGAVALNVMLCAALVPHMGAQGAMIATAAAFWLFYVLRTELAVAVWRAFRRRQIHGYAAVALLGSVAISFSSRRFSWLVALVCAVAFCVVLWRERQLIIACVFDVIRRRRVDQAPAATE